MPLRAWQPPADRRPPPSPPPGASAAAVARVNLVVARARGQLLVARARLEATRRDHARRMDRSRSVRDRAAALVGAPGAGAPTPSRRAEGPRAT